MRFGGRLLVLVITDPLADERNWGKPIAYKNFVNMPVLTR